MATLSIRSNVASLNAQRNINRTTEQLNKAIGNLSSGQRINVAGDDPAGLAVSEKLQTNINSLEQATRNANDGVSLLQQAEGSLSIVAGIMHRMRELAIESSNDTLTDADRVFLNDEFTALKEEIDRVSETTKFNSQSLIDGTFSSTALDFQVGIENGADFRISVTIGNIGTESLGSASTNLSATAVTSKTNARTALDVIDAAIQDISTLRSTLGSKQHALQTAMSANEAAFENLNAANSRIRDVDMAEETANFTSLQILQQAGAAMLAQANTQPQIALQLLQG